VWMHMLQKAFARTLLTSWVRGIEHIIITLSSGGMSIQK
jgi:hypothetical protein